MATYDEFRLVAQPPLMGGGPWTMQIAESPIAGSIGRTASLQSTMQRQQLDELRQAGFNDIAKLQKVGEAVWDSVLSNQLGPFLLAAMQHSSSRGRRLRVVLVRHGTDAVPPAGLVSVSELPFEALFEATNAFLAVDDHTPISRGLQVRADRAAEVVSRDLRVLLYGGDPVDKASTQAAAEVSDIDNILKALPGVTVTTVVDGSYTDFRAAVNAIKPHVVHFAGHGGYSIVGSDPNPRPHLCFVDNTTKLTVEVDADTLAVLLKSVGVRLVVMTACASAAVAPPFMPYPIRALEGIAQRLVVGNSGVSGAVAMQFDIESPAALTFSKKFYESLLKPEVCLDEAVTLARREVSQTNSLGHRAWVNPTVFWRCIDGRVFELNTGLSDAARLELVPWDSKLEANLKFLTDFATDPVFGLGQTQKVLDGIRTIEEERSKLYGQGMRFTPATAAAGRQVQLQLLLRTTTGGTLDKLALHLVLPSGLSFVGAQTTVDLALLSGKVNESVARIIIERTPTSSDWIPGEREIARITLAVDAAQPPGVLFLAAEQIDLQLNGASIPIRASTSPFFVHQG